MSDNQEQMFINDTLVDNAITALDEVVNDKNVKPTDRVSAAKAILAYSKYAFRKEVSQQEPVQVSIKY